MFESVNMYELVLKVSNTKNVRELSFLIFLVLHMRVLTMSSILFGMHVYVWWQIRGTISGEERGVSPALFLKNKKICPNNGKNAFIHRWIKCSSMLSFKLH